MCVWVQMDLHELQMAAAEGASIEAALGDARRGVAEAEAERQRLAAEGPASHRKKDLLDKVGGLCGLTLWRTNRLTVYDCPRLSGNTKSY